MASLTCDPFDCLPDFCFFQCSCPRPQTGPARILDVDLGRCLRGHLQRTGHTTTRMVSESQEIPTALSVPRPHACTRGHKPQPPRLATRCIIHLLPASHHHSQSNRPIRLRAQATRFRAPPAVPQPAPIGREAKTSSPRSKRKASPPRATQYRYSTWSTLLEETSRCPCLKRLHPHVSPPRRSAGLNQPLNPLRHDSNHRTVPPRPPRPIRDNLATTTDR
ncbi:hypothetical protein BD413DRAFT_147220 [Trametes elegans]|nr:hypothetical protein BD413DRAFT_147220 [Trametes elegans]